jgi:hypothetical protein
VSRGTSTAPIVVEEIMTTMQQSKSENGKRKSEGDMTKKVERQTAGIPSLVFLGVAGAAVAASVTLRFMGQKNASLFVGEWVPTILMLGIYNKIVKTIGSDRMERSPM